MAGGPWAGDPGRLARRLVEVLGDRGRVRTGLSDRQQHGRDLTVHPPHDPDVVVYPESTSEVRAVLRLAAQERVPVVPFGAGSSLEGHVIPVHGGISLDLTRMDAVLALDPVGRVARVQPGLTRSRFNAYLAREGLFFPVDPGADATLGGMAATNASGTNALRYGAMKHQVLGLEVVLAGGRVVRTGTLARGTGTAAALGGTACTGTGRDAATGVTGDIATGADGTRGAGEAVAGPNAALPGWDLTPLFVGSEGTLGVITTLEVRVYPLPEAVVAARVVFPVLEAAARAAVEVARRCPSATRIELLDERTLAAVNAYRGTAYPERPTLFLEWSGMPAAVEADAARGRQACEAYGGTGFVMERDPAGRDRLWDARHHAGLAVTAVAPGRKKLSTDVCVPLSQLPAAIRHARATVDALGFAAGIVAHAGDGNFHVLFAIDPSDPDELRRARQASAAIVRDALARGGTCTGEHGVGLGKRDYLRDQHGPAVAVMAALKALLDPLGILNPGKVLPET
ncbi:FAD linked oxidase domain protein [Thermaerobacter marianensis DSM 12885]|uniref:D-lactate dehydrogenase (cytochrome) n=1 Tax=Thermaerobacter marianensis (strain ATCC 700841 / DSM 12885 / JCM 10246 / 7p75a) TaxID=644966 RepID=E6SJU0_THEM7|nr:FAD-linked oxidase C-terminal domain-containing protein [Thermaerobacter marianensis]ADU52173.1 FAD linked oxidase domain protein [Thermaerobacter marianensis DSM 12885]